MSESRPENGPREISRFRAIVVAALRAKQLRRGSKPRIEPDGHKHKDISIAMEEVRRGLIIFSQAVRDVQDPDAARDVKAEIEQPLPVVR